MYNSTALKNNLEKKVLYTTIMALCHWSLKQGGMHSFPSLYIAIDLWSDGLRGSCLLKLFPSSADHELGSEMIWTLDIFKDKNFSQCDRERKTGRKDDFITLLYSYQAKLRDTRKTEKWRFQHGA